MASDGAAADPAYVFDLAAEGVEAGRVERVYGSTGFGGAGTPVAGGVDCDGDGHADMALSSIQASPLGRDKAGELVLVFGDGTVGGAEDTAGFSVGQLKIAGSHAYEVAGAEIWMDDVTGDGIGDLLIGRQNFSPNEGDEQTPSYRLGAGALTLLVGGPELKAAAAGLAHLDLADPPAGVTLLTVLGAKAFDRMGIWMRTGDVNADGIADIAVGADQEDANNEPERGAVYVILGGAHLNTQTTVDLAAFGTTALAGKVLKIRPRSGSAGFHFGSTTQVCDLDGNGRAEVLASAALQRAGATIGVGHDGVNFVFNSSAGFGGSEDGSAFIIWDDNFPDEPWPAGLEVSLDAAPGGVTSIHGGAENNAFGEELLGGFDADGDGQSELAVGDIIGAPGGVINAGSAHVFFDASNLKNRDFEVGAVPVGLKVVSISGTRVGAISGDTMGAGDIDGDGFDDLVVGNPHDWPQGRVNAGSMHVLYGRASGWPADVALSESSLPESTTIRIARIDGAKPGDVLCYSLALGDMDGDSRPDLIVNEMLGDGVLPSAQNVGNLLQLSGGEISRPTLEAVRTEGGSLVFEVFLRTDREYQLQRRDSLGGSIWMDVGGVVQGGDSVSVWMAEMSAGSRRFFRVVEREQEP